MKKREELKNFKGKVQNINKIASNIYELKISSELPEAHSGQFISISIPNKTFHRPFSIADFDKDKKITTVLFKLKGEGTNYLANLKTNDNIEFLAPLGNKFNLINKNSLLVGAGIGIAPMLFLKKELDESDIKNYLISGFRTNDEVIFGSDENVIGGSVLDNLDKIVKEKNIEIIYSCGPKVVLKEICNIAKNNNIDCFIALEKVMACSIGVCRGCAIKLNRDDKIMRASVCKDGPIFKGDEVIWED